jgi:integrase
MARHPRHVRKLNTRAGIRHESRINATARDGSRIQLRRRFKTPEAADTWWRETTAEIADGGQVGSVAGHCPA